MHVPPRRNIVNSPGSPALNTRATLEPEVLRVKGDLRAAVAAVEGDVLDDVHDEAGGGKGG